MIHQVAHDREHESHEEDEREEEEEYLADGFDADTAPTGQAVPDMSPQTGPQMQQEHRRGSVTAGGGGVVGGVGGGGVTGGPTVATTPGANADGQGGAVGGYNDGMCNVWCIVDCNGGICNVEYVVPYIILR
jgi:hypothetical protein